MIESTFRWDDGRYISTSTPEALSPICVIATALRSRVVLGNTVDFPQDLSQVDLDKRAGLNSITNLPFNIRPGTAQRLKALASQLLELNSNRQIRPPFNDAETAVLLHLIELVPVPVEPIQ